MERLSDSKLAGLCPEPGQKDRLVFDTECRGLGVRLTATGGKVFIVQ